MKLTVKAMKKDGTAFMATDSVWYNADRKAKPDFSVLSPGAEIEVTESNDTWIKSFTLAKPGSPKSAPKTNSSTPREHDGAVTRATAVKAVLGSPMLAEQTKGDSLEDAFARAKQMIREVVEFISNDKFPSDGAK